MKILFVNRHVNDAGGVEHYINALAGRLNSAGHNTGIIHWDEAAGTPFFHKSWLIKALWDSELALEGKTTGGLDKVLEQFQPDIVYLHNNENWRAIRWFDERCRAVRYVHGYKTVDPDGKMMLRNPLEVNDYPLSPTYFLRAFTRGAMPRNPVKGARAYIRAKKVLEETRRLRKVIVASDHMKATLVMNGVDPGRIDVLPYFVDYQSQHDSAPEKKRMLFAGRIAEGKGLDMLCDVLRLLKEDYIIDIAGTGPMEKIFREKVSDAGLSDKVVFHGWVDHKDLASFYRRSSFLIVPSVWPEPFGICGIEAAFFARPAIAFNVGGISDWLVDGQTGFLVAPYDKESMAEKIDNFLSDPETCGKMGAKARELAIEKYSPEGHIEKLMRIFAS